jgi:hypothetical protein
VVSGGAGLEPAVRAELLCILAEDADAVLADRARNALLVVAPEVLLDAARMPDAAPSLFEYVAGSVADHGAAAEALASNPQCPAAVLARMAAHFPPAAVQGLLDNLQRLTSSQELIAALAAREDLSAEQKKTLAELTEEASPEELEKSFADAEASPEKRKTLLQKLAMMTVLERLTLALKGGREERMALIKDPNKMVQRCVLQSPRLTEQEVEAFAAMTNVTEEVLRTISLNRNFVKNYSIVRNLTKNPKTPIDVSLHLLQRLTTPDLKQLGMNKNIPETVRSVAVKMSRVRAVKG